ncbi:MAG: dUTP diphosphatase [Candidatus Dojkabacteria bacterium]
MGDKLEIRYKKLHKDAKVPLHGSDRAAGYDLYARTEVEIAPSETELIPTGIALELPEGYFAMLAPRGSLAIKKNLDMPHSVGIMDEDYVGEYFVPLRNLGKKPFKIDKHERIAQLIVLPFQLVEFVQVNELKQTKRGEGRFASTGKK